MTLTATIPARVLVTKIGLDGHDRGSRIGSGIRPRSGAQGPLSARAQKNHYRPLQRPMNMRF